MCRGRCRDAYENGRDGPPDVNWRGRIAEMAAKEGDDLVAEFGQGLRGVTGKFVVGKMFQ